MTCSCNGEAHVHKRYNIGPFALEGECCVLSLFEGARPNGQLYIKPAGVGRVSQNTHPRVYRLSMEFRASMSHVSTMWTRSRPVVNVRQSTLTSTRCETEPRIAHEERKIRCRNTACDRRVKGKHCPVLSPVVRGPES